MRDALLSKYSDNLRQLDSIIALMEEFNQTCAKQSIEARMGFEEIEKFLAGTKAAYDEIRVSPSWKVFLKYPNYWQLAELHAQHFAPLEVQLQDTIKEIGQSAGP